MAVIYTTKDVQIQKRNTDDNFSQLNSHMIIGANSISSIQNLYYVYALYVSDADTSKSYFRKLDADLGYLTDSPEFGYMNRYMCINGGYIYALGAQGDTKLYKINHLHYILLYYNLLLKYIYKCHHSRYYDIHFPMNIQYHLMLQQLNQRYLSYII